MPINPITVKRLPTFVLVGHSNADGWASSKLMLESNDWLMPVAGGNWVNSRITPDRAYWKNVYVATSAQPFPLPPSSPTAIPPAADSENAPVASLVSTVQWQEMTISNPSSPAAAHPHASPYKFPNVRGSCYPNWLFNSYKAAGTGFVRLADFSDVSTNGCLVGLELPLSWHFKHHYGTQIGVVKMAFSSSFMMAAEGGAGADQWIDPFGASQQSKDTPPANPEYVRSAVPASAGFHAWWTPSEAFDWAPSTKRFFRLWQEKMLGAKAALPSGSKMDVRLIVPWMGDNEAGRGDDGKRNALVTFESTARSIIREMRTFIFENDMSTLPAHQIAIVWPKIFREYGEDDIRAELNAALDRIAADDPYVRLVETDDLPTMLDDGYATLGGAPGLGNHFGHTGYVKAAQRVFESMVEIENEPFDAISDEDRVTLQEIQDRVKTYYNRSRTQTDVEDTVALNQHINGALDRILNDVGDNAYWLRRKSPFTYNLGENNVTDMPRHVTRVLKIENPHDIRETLHFRQVGFADAGRLQIHLEESSGQTSYVTHFITRPKQVTKAEELVPLPRSICEWLVVETCRRLARAGTNVALQASLEGEARDLRERCIKELQVMQRTKKDRLHTIRRLPGRNNLNAFRNHW
jgi:hypothetical protein